MISTGAQSVIFPARTYGVDATTLGRLAKSAELL
jgi:hypothetical protein